MKRIAPTALAALILTLAAGCDGTGRDPAARIDGPSWRTAFHVEGMHCNGCAEAIVAELSETPGVRSATCSFETKRCDVELLPTAKADTAAKAIRKLGYTVTPESPAESK
jgi:copper chaperone CopZ